MRVFAARAHAGGLSPRSVQRRLSAVRGFFNYLLRERIVASNPALDIRAPKAARRLPGTLDVDQLNQLLDIPPEDALAVRDKAIMELFYSSGLRLDELVGLDIAHLDLRRPHGARARQGPQDAHRARGPQGRRRAARLAARARDALADVGGARAVRRAGTARA